MNQRKRNKKITAEINKIEYKKQYERSRKLRAGFLNIFLKIEKPLARIIERKRESTQINIIRNGRGEITTNITDILTITNLQNYTPKLDNLEEMNELLETNKCP